MNLKSLQIFATIMEKGSLAKAADQHCLSESAASRQLSQLEAEIGFALFSREKRSLKPTAKGEAFYKEVRRILYGFDNIPDIIEDIKRNENTKLRVVGIPRLVRHILSPAVARTCQQRQDLQVHVEIQAMRTLEKWVAGFQFNIGLGRVPTRHPAIVTETFCSLPTVVVLPYNHPLSKRSELTLSDLDGMPMVSMIKDTLLAKDIEGLYHTEGRESQPVIEVATSYSACSIVASGYGYTIGDPLTAHSLGEKNVSIVPLNTDFMFDFAFFEPTNFELSEASQLFKQNIQAVAAEYKNKHGF
ncbi:LysR family transcriptional regulator [Photobacterium sp. DNB22_13_2]